MSVFDWAVERHLERLNFRPVAPGLVLDVSRSHIGELTISHGEVPVTLLGVEADRTHRLAFQGEPSLLTVIPGPGELPSITLALPGQPAPDGIPAPADGSGPTRALPPMAGLAEVRSLDVYTAPLDVPVDLRSLTQFPHLRRLSLWGAVAHPEALAELALTSLSLRMVPDLTGLPPLTAWPELTSFLAWNIDTVVGKRLRAEIKKRGASDSQNWDVSQLRTASWFVTESGLPFAGWPRKRAKQAVAAFKAAAKLLDGAADQPAAAREAVEGFTRALNDLGDLDTADREDAGTAVCQLARLAVPPVPEEAALGWFDDLRDF
jgi:hypothetical protein